MMQPIKGVTQEDILGGMTMTDLHNLHEVAAREAYRAVTTLSKIRAEMRKRIGCDLPPPPGEDRGCDVSTISRYELETIDSDIDDVFG
jgi:hypothetical protein